MQHELGQYIISATIAHKENFPFAADNECEQTSARSPVDEEGWGLSYDPLYLEWMQCFAKPG